ncbi:hypothetical protein BJ912DRAFT_50007 [Pholiota molesta]|nr:hypothetical protein BJ912DRAFT_50007 [Pholiota molesta]
MQILILGATGPSGLCLVRKSLSVYPDAAIILYVRSPQKIPTGLATNPAITIREGTLNELDKVEDAIKGADVILSALGPIPGNHPKGNPIATFYGHVIHFMWKHSVKCIILLGTSVITDTKDRFILPYNLLFAAIRIAISAPYWDIITTGETFMTQADNIDWTIVRVPILTDAPTEGVVAGYKGDVGIWLSRAAYAAFSVGEIEKREWIRKTPLIADQ